MQRAHAASAPAQAPAAPTTLVGGPSLRFGATRAAAEDDVIKEVELLKSIDQCAPAQAARKLGC
jgi:hypothetical protein